MPKISVIMTSYNYALYIGEAIESVLHQTFQDWELIVIDDNSSDDSVSIIEKFNDTRIKLIKNAKNLGLAKSLQIGLRHAKGEWIAFLESDDKFSEMSLEEKLKATESGADIVFTSIETIPKDDENTRVLYINKRNSIINLDKTGFVDNIPAIIIKINPIPTFSASMVKKEICLGVKFNPIYHPALDHYIWAQLSNCKFYYINMPLTYWRKHEDSYLNVEKCSHLKRLLFDFSIFKFSIQKLSLMQRFLKILDYIRKTIVNINITDNKIRIQLFRYKNIKINYHKQ